MRTLKMRADIPFHLESMLVHKFKYVVSRREVGNFILFQESQNITPGKQQMSLHEIMEANKKKKLNENLTTAQIDDLTQRCLTVVNSFADPTNHVGTIRARLYNISQTLAQSAERIYVIQWMDEKFPSPLALGLKLEPSEIVLEVIEPKKMGTMPPVDKPSRVWDTIPANIAVCKELEQRCDRIVAHFQDPFNNIVPVRTRLRNMAMTLATAPERQYIQDYMDDNFPIEAK